MLHQIKLIQLSAGHRIGGTLTDAQSRELFRVRGRGVHNPEFWHRIIRMGSDLQLMAQPGVISNGRMASDQQFVAAPVHIGSYMLVDGTGYKITARTLADPELVPVDGLVVEALLIDGTWSVHNAGCADVARKALFSAHGQSLITAGPDQQSVGEWLNSDFIAEGAITPAHALDDVSFAPCLAGLPMNAGRAGNG